MGLPTLDGCRFYTTTTAGGRFVGRVEQFASIKTRAHDKAMDALDEVMTLTRDKLAQLDDAAAGFGPARHAQR